MAGSKISEQHKRFGRGITRRRDLWNFDRQGSQRDYYVHVREELAREYPEQIILRPVDVRKFLYDFRKELKLDTHVIMTSYDSASTTSYITVGQLVVKEKSAKKLVARHGGEYMKLSQLGVKING